MLILKKMIIMGSVNGSGGSGVVKLENFAGRTACSVNIPSAPAGSVLAVASDNEMVWCRPLRDGKFYFDRELDLNAFTQAIVLSGNNVVCVGSTKGVFCHYGALAEKARRYSAPQLPEETTEQPSAEPERDEGASETVQQAQAITDSDEGLTAAASEPPFEAIAPEPPEETETAAETAEVASEKQTAGKPIEAAPKSETGAEKPIPPRAEASEDRPAERVTTATKSVRFYDNIRRQMDNLMEKHPHDEELEALMEHSRWVRVPIEDSAYYVVGVLEENGLPAVICYGIPDRNAQNPPDCKENCRQWLELEKDGRGYWMMYQNAATGETMTEAV